LESTDIKSIVGRCILHKEIGFIALLVDGPESLCIDEKLVRWNLRDVFNPIYFGLRYWHSFHAFGLLVAYVELLVLFVDHEVVFER
jgi:hypothetical protein